MPRHRATAAPITSPIFGSNPYSNAHAGASMTPSRLMNSCTSTAPISDLPGLHDVPVRCRLVDADAPGESSLGPTGERLEPAARQRPPPLVHLPRASHDPDGQHPPEA